METKSFSSYLSALLWALPLFFVFLFFSCEKIDLSDLDSEDQKIVQGKHDVRIITRSSSTLTDADFPIVVYALDSDGKKVAEQTLSSLADELNFHLVSGEYRLVARNESCLGYAEVNVLSTNVTVTIMLVRQKARVSMLLVGLPSDVSSVNVTMSTLYTQIDMNGVLAQPGSVSFDLLPQESISPSDGVWAIRDFYVYPSLTKTVTFTISITEPNQTRSYSYVYDQGIERDVPYNFSGSYQGFPDAFNVSGFIDIEDWKTEKVVNFDFGPAVNTQIQPTIGVHCPVTENLYISLQEWSNLGSANNESNPNQAREIANSYTEGELSNWRIPTEEEAKEIRSLYLGEALVNLNALLTEKGGSPVQDYEIDESTARYLCERAYKTFSFANTNISTAGAKVDTYRLRLVHDR